MSIFPFIDFESYQTEESGANLPMLKEYAFDFEKNELMTDSQGKTHMVEGNEALCIWIHKALLTSRFNHTAYSPDFGTEWQENIIGHTINGDILKLEMERYVVEALMVNPYIRSLNNFLFENSLSGLTVTFDCTSIYGNQKMSFRAKEVSI